MLELMIGDFGMGNGLLIHGFEIDTSKIMANFFENIEKNYVENYNCYEKHICEMILLKQKL